MKKKEIILGFLFLATSIFFSKSPTENLFSISGKVLSERSHQPVVTRIEIKNKDSGLIKVTTNQNGEFNVVLPGSGEYQVVVKEDGYESHVQKIDFTQIVKSDKPLVIELVPIVKLKIVGAIFKARDLQPLAAEVSIYRNSDFIEDSKEVFSSSFVQSLKDYGWYIIKVQSPGFQKVMDTVWVLSCRREQIEKNYYLDPLRLDFRCL